MTKKSFILYHDLCEVFGELTDEQAGQLIKNIVDYSLYKTQKNPEEPAGLSGLMNAVFNPFKSHIDRDFEAWEARRLISIENGKKGGRKPKPKNPKKGVKVNAKVKDNDNGNVNEVYTREFELFWSVYPRKAKKQESFKSYTRQIKEGATYEIIIRSAREHAASWNGTETKYIPHATSWLNQCRYNEQPEAIDNRPKQGGFADIASVLLESGGV